MYSRDNDMHLQFIKNYGIYVNSFFGKHKDFRTLCIQLSSPNLYAIISCVLILFI